MKKPSDFIYGMVATVLAGLILFFLKSYFSPERELIYDINIIEENDKGIYLDIELHNMGNSLEENVTLKLNKYDKFEIKKRANSIDGISADMPLPEMVPIKEKSYYETSSDIINVKSVSNFYIINFGTLLPEQKETLKGFFVGANIPANFFQNELNIKSSRTKAKLSYLSNIKIFYPTGFWFFGAILFLLIVALTYELNFRPYENKVKDAKKAYEDLLDQESIKGNK